MIKAVFFDIDGTLLSFNTHRIPQSTIDAFSELRSRGIKTFVATGRAPYHINNLEDLSFDGYITTNGSYCMNADHDVIHMSTIPSGDIEALIRYQEEGNEQFPVSFMTTEKMLINYIDEKVIALSELVGVSPPPLGSLHEAARSEVLQLDVYIDKEKERKIMREVFVNCQASRWNPIFTDINLRGCSKQSGIDHMLEHYGIRLDETMCFGDGGNDIPMLRHVAIGVAMGNAADEVKRTANYVTDTVDDNGIWNTLKHFKIIG